MKEYTCPAIPGNLRPVLSVVAEEMIACGTDVGVRQRVFVILEELFNNVAYHAYADEAAPGPVRVVILADQDTVRLEIADRGKPFNPLEVDDGDRLARLEAMEAGHAGIFLVRTLAKELDYVREDGWNRITALVSA